MANRETVVKRLVSAVNQIHRWVDIVFPELRQVFKISAIALAGRVKESTAKQKKAVRCDSLVGWEYNEY